MLKKLALSSALPVLCALTVVAPAADAVTPPHCWSGDVCLWPGIRYGGIAVEYFGGRGSTVHPANQTSSWVNASSSRMCAYDRKLFSGKLLWTMAPRSHSEWVGTAANDKVDYIKPC